MEKSVFERDLKVKNADGMHMRPAMQFVDVASKFSSDISVSNGKVNVDGKSIMQMSMLAATCGSILRVKAQGTDAEKAIVALVELVEGKMFDEPEPGA